MSQPNIVLLHTHDLGQQVQPYGYPHRTPAIQALAEEGVLFRNHFCIAPTCSPARAATMTGRYPHQVGMHGLASPNAGFKLRDNTEHIAHLLRENGYTTALAGVQHVVTLPWGDPFDLPYDTFLNHELPDRHWDNWTTIERAIDYIDEPKDRPFFLSIGLDDTHRHWWEKTCERSESTMGRVDSRYTRPYAIFPNLADQRQDAAMFSRTIEFMDRRVGQVLAAIDANGLKDNTLFILTTDHGPGLPRMKSHLTDGGCATMFIVRGPSSAKATEGKPGCFVGGKTVEAMTTHMDLYPTICDILGIDRPDGLTGKSLLPLVNGDIDDLHDAVFLEQGYHGHAKPVRAIRTKRWKYIRAYDPDMTWGKMDADGGKTHDFWYDHGYNDIPYPAELLFDLYLDPMECNNLATDPAHQEIKADLSARLTAWQEEQGDPLFDGSLPLPPGQLDPTWTERLPDGHYRSKLQYPVDPSPAKPGHGPGQLRPSPPTPDS